MKRIIAVLLAGVLLLSMFGCIRISCSVPIRYSNADKYTAGNFTYEETKVKKVEIEWLAGSVTLLNGKGTLSVSESGEQDLSEEEQMHWWLDGTTLRIKYCKSGKELSLSKMEKKDLTVELPAFVDLKLDIASGKIVSENMLDLGTFDLDKASGNADIRFLSAEKVNIKTASGATAFGKVSVSGAFEIDTASGGLTVDEISANEIDVDSASGGITLGIADASKVRINSTSGSVKLTLSDKEAGARIKFDAVSGDFNTALSVVNSGDLMTIGEGKIDMEIKVVSGTVTVE
jgi:DUF4097 and DUF4098 domain-containing protein YvlB